MDGRRFTRRKIADAHREDARPFLLGDGGAMALPDGAIVLLACGTAFLQLPLDDAAGNLQAEARHRGAIGKREDVGRLQRFGVRVDECLAGRQPRRLIP